MAVRAVLVPSHQFLKILNNVHIYSSYSIFRTKSIEKNLVFQKFFTSFLQKSRPSEKTLGLLPYFYYFIQSKISKFQEVYLILFQ